MEIEKGKEEGERKTSLEQKYEGWVRRCIHACTKFKLELKTSLEPAGQHSLTEY